MSEGPLQESIVLSFHQSQEEGQVSCLATTISVHVQSKTGLVPLLACIEGSRVQRNGLADPCLMSCSLDLWDLPDEGCRVWDLLLGS